MGNSTCHGHSGKFFSRHGHSSSKHNFIRLWSGYKLGRAPIPYQRTGPAAALDGMPKVDLARFDPRFFERLRSRVIAARDRGVYVGIMMFAPEGAKKEDWPHLEVQEKE